MAHRLFDQGKAFQIWPLPHCSDERVETAEQTRSQHELAFHGSHTGLEEANILLNGIFWG